MCFVCVGLRLFFNTAMFGKEVVIEILFWKSEQIGSKVGKLNKSLSPKIHTSIR